ncbi:MAG: carboxypeptidase regulatory-like domain-containing protein [Labilithrix sp.]|nr:carboxypeptidase regulatory-like domain-containing protein [Labilithrix sp.]
MRGLVFVLALVVVACTSSVVGMGPLRVGGDAGDEPLGDGSRDAGDGDVSTPSPDGGPEEDDAGADPVFGGLPPFGYVDPGITANDAHPSHGGSVGGKDCAVGGCHDSGSTKPFLFSGTVFSSTGSGLVRAEVRIVQAAGAVVGSVHTDVNGNFWLPLEPGASIPAYSRVGVRSANETRLMPSWIHSPDGSCSRAACHGAATPGYVTITP